MTTRRAGSARNTWIQRLTSPEWRGFYVIATVFLAAYFVPFEHPRVSQALVESCLMLQEYARDHVLLCLVPALFIAGAIANFLSQGAVVRYFGAGASKIVAYSVASVSGTILAVCSCTVLPLFAGIYRRGAGIGPATTFLYAGPAINILAIILTGRILGWQLALARAIGAVVFAIVIGLLMAAMFNDDDRTEQTTTTLGDPTTELDTRSPVQNALFFVTLVAILVFAAWGKPAESMGFWSAIYGTKWPITGALLLLLCLILSRWFTGEERSAWVRASWGFGQQILPLLFGGVLVAGLLMGRPGTDAGLIPSRYVAMAVGGNSLAANLLASVAGAFMYFATLTEVPILQGLLGSGMGQGPALALLLAGPALSLPSMLVLRSVLGTKKTMVFVGLVIATATTAGILFGSLMG
jgi:uncharacterized membrane protein YraQ (UPF0718 family)